MINRAGPTFAREVADAAGAAPDEVVKAYLISRTVFRLSRLWREIEALDNRASAAVQTRLNLDIVRLLRRSTIWLLRNGPKPLGIAPTIERFQDGIEALAVGLAGFIPEETGDEIEREARRAAEAGVPMSLAREVASLNALYSGCDIVNIATDAGRRVEDVARVYFAAGHRFGLDWLRRRAAALTAESEWQSRAAASIVDDLYVQQSALTARIVQRMARGRDVPAAIERWWKTNEQAVARAGNVVAELRIAGSVDLAMLSVAGREIRALAEQ